MMKKKKQKQKQKQNKTKQKKKRRNCGIQPILASLDSSLICKHELMQFIP